MGDQDHSCCSSIPKQVISGGDGVVPGDPVSLDTKVLGLGAAAVQNFKPLKQICRHIVGYHCYSHDINRQVEAHHLCSHLSEDVCQCVIYDSAEADARLIGVEYIISARLYNDLPEEEREYWHSHVYEVKGGIISLPMLSLIPRSMHKEIENHELSKIVNTWGKTWHLWQVDRGDILPFGPPSLMTSFTRPGQIDPELLEARDEREGVSTADLIERRKEIAADAQAGNAQERLYGEGVALQARVERVTLQK
ncbi:DUF1264-domain-containing protein [Fimicolochytrium jonesii]|uniref:DUF1264-domain-containing protein n=1 Tax=Fimicolochytrium jonesii TaxID=1396493 RepID=UPI0022FEC530|nr:DUF1264-domain-containing protein [Fimicolochytrium jonesii]KAI8819405.1 DUF1264-domain-containing protein [Fimicolochytrium jonesii]